MARDANWFGAKTLRMPADLTVRIDWSAICGRSFPIENRQCPSPSGLRRIEDEMLLQDPRDLVGIRFEEGPDASGVHRGDRKLRLTLLPPAAPPMPHRRAGWRAPLEGRRDPRSISPYAGPTA